MPFDGLFTGLAGIGQSLIDARTQKRNVDKTIAANREMAEYQYSRDLEMWHLQNAYNSPESQMARFKAAGLNPNLIYGQGNSGNASSMPSYQAPRAEYNYKSPVNLPALISMYQDVQMKSAQIDLVREQANTARELNMYGYGMYRATGERERASEAGWRAKVLSGQAVYSDEMAKEQLRRARLANEGAVAENLFKKYRNQWMAAGVTTSDNPFLRMVIRGFYHSRDAGVFDDFGHPQFNKGTREQKESWKY